MRLGLFRAWLPYILIGVFLFLTRWKGLPFVEWMQTLTFQKENLFGTSITTSKFQPLYLPGTIFVFVTILTCFLHKMNFTGYKRALTRSIKTTFAASVALVFTVPMVQVFINSGGGAAEYVKMPIALAEGVANLTGYAWPIFSPFIGGIGAFVAGSNTSSNMMFSLFQYDVGQRIGVDPTWIVALQAVGGAAGNVICVHNVVAASAVVGLLGKEGMVIRKTLWVFFYYALLAGSVGYSIVWFHKKGIFNLGTIIACLIALTAAGVILRHVMNKQGTNSL